MDYVYSSDYGQQPKYLAYYDKSVDKGILQNLKEEKLSIQALCTKIYRECRKPKYTPMANLYVYEDKIRLIRDETLYEGPLRDYWTTVLAVTTGIGD